MAAIALGALILLIVGVVLFQGGSADDDRLTGDEIASTSQSPEERCTDQRVYDRIKRELFRTAGVLRGSDQADFDKIAAYSALRVEAPVLRDDNAEIRSVTCNATLTLDLPPGVAVVGGRRSLGSDVLYTIQPSADGTGDVVTLSDAEGIVTPLATLAKVGEQPQDETNTTNAVTIDPLAPTDGPVPAKPDDPSAPAASGSTANPSFNCTNASTSGEIAVCGDEQLAAMDRRMAAQYRAAIADASASQRALLQQTRDAFLRYRDGCPDNNCIAQTYQGRMREIRDIMMGTYRPRR